MCLGLLQIKKYEESSIGSKLVRFFFTSSIIRICAGGKLFNETKIMIQKSHSGRLWDVFLWIHTTACRYGKNNYCDFFHLVFMIYLHYLISFIYINTTHLYYFIAVTIA